MSKRLFPSFWNFLYSKIIWNLKIPCSPTSLWTVSVSHSESMWWFWHQTGKQYQEMSLHTLSFAHALLLTICSGQALDLADSLSDKKEQVGQWKSFQFLTKAHFTYWYIRSTQASQPFPSLSLRLAWCDGNGAPGFSRTVSPHSGWANPSSGTPACSASMSINLRILLWNQNKKAEDPFLIVFSS